MGSKASKADSGNDPDDVWSNKFKEKGKNDLYKWGAPGQPAPSPRPISTFQMATW